MLTIALVDRIGSGLWASVSVLYFTYVSELSLAQVGTLAAAAGAIGIAGAPMGGKLADRFPITRVLLTVQLIRAVASCALLTTDNYALLIAFSAVGGLGDRAASILTKLYATRVAGPDRVRYQAFHRTVANAGWALGGLAAAAALALGTTAAYQWLLAGDALSFVASALLTLRCGEPPSSSRTVTTSKHPAPTTRPTTPWRDRTYLAYVATETVLFLDDAVFKVGLPLWIAHESNAPNGLAPLLMVLNNVMVVALQVPSPDSAPPQRLPGTSSSRSPPPSLWAAPPWHSRPRAEPSPPQRSSPPRQRPSPWPRCCTPPSPGNSP